MNIAGKSNSIAVRISFWYVVFTAFSFAFQWFQGEDTLTRLVRYAVNLFVPIPIIGLNGYGLLVFFRAFPLVLLTMVGIELLLARSQLSVPIKLAIILSSLFTVTVFTYLLFWPQLLKLLIRGRI